MKINFRGVCQLKYHHKFIIKEGEPFFYYELLVLCSLAWPDHYFYRALSASDNACVKKEVWPRKTRYRVGQKFGKFTKLPNFICQKFCNSITIINNLMFSPNFILPNWFFTFSSNFSLTKLLSYSYVQCVYYNNRLNMYKFPFSTS